MVYGGGYLFSPKGPVGFGNATTSFWIDYWFGNDILPKAYLRLFSLPTQKETIVRSPSSQYSNLALRRSGRS